MLVELQLVEQRYQAVLEALEGATVTDVARRFGVTRQTVHVWLARYGRSCPTHPERRIPPRRKQPPSSRRLRGP